ncbi:permease prefix domain 1-containing protein [Streptomyces sp. NPDC050619]|uniref:permease prefix domain 1-containing protein n=1 Tax=Streptomyces sp. NPDC050619 TaxID=3157214 RepID=UPI00343E356B
MIDRYVAELDQALRGPRAVKADMIAEARDSLLDAAEVYEETGLDRERAERCAVDDFGSVQLIAPEYQVELGLAQGRRTALLICAVLTVQPVAWWGLLHLAGQGADDSGSTGYALINTVVRWTGAGAIVMALAVVIATGAGVRYLGPASRLVRVAGVFACAVSVVFAVLGLLLTLYSPATDSLLGITGLPGTALLLGVPLISIAVAGRRCLSAA